MAPLPSCTSCRHRDHRRVNTPHKRIIVTIDLEDDPSVEVIAIQALLHHVEWLRHEGIASGRTTLEITPSDHPTTVPTTPARPHLVSDQHVVAVLIERVAQHMTRSRLTRWWQVRRRATCECG